MRQVLVVKKAGRLTRQNPLAPDPAVPLELNDFERVIAVRTARAPMPDGAVTYDLVWEADLEVDVTARREAREQERMQPRPAPADVQSCAGCGAVWRRPEPLEQCPHCGRSVGDEAPPRDPGKPEHGWHPLRWLFGGRS